MLAVAIPISDALKLQTAFVFLSAGPLLAPCGDPKFHQPLIVDGVGKSTRASFAILNKGCLFRVGVFIILSVLVVP